MEFARTASETRLEVIDGEMPRLAPSPCLDGCYRPGRQSELRSECGAAHLNGTDSIDRHLDRVLAGDRVGGIGVVENQRALVAARPANVQQAIWPSHDARDQWQGILKSFAGNGSSLHVLRVDGFHASGNRVCIGPRTAGYGDFLVKGFQIESQLEVGRFARLHNHGHRHRSQTLEFGDDGTRVGRHIVEPEPTFVARHFGARLSIRTGQRECDTWN